MTWPLCSNGVLRRTKNLILVLGSIQHTNKGMRFAIRWTNFFWLLLPSSDYRGVLLFHNVCLLLMPQHMSWDITLPHSEYTAGSRALGDPCIYI